MKHVFTVSLDIETVAKVREAARSSKFRNKSHLVEEALNEFLKNNSNVDNNNKVISKNNSNSPNPPNPPDTPNLPNPQKEVEE